MPLADMFWGDRYGVLAIATHKEDLTPEEVRKRAQSACAHEAMKG
jgi:PhnB protein